MSVEWESKKVGDVLQLEYGKPLPDEDRSDAGKYPVYGANGEKARSSKFYCDKSTIIVGRKGSAGELKMSEEKFWPLDVTYFAIFDNSRYELKFLYYLLGMLDLPSMARGVKPGINRNDVYALGVRVPPIEEQQRIVAILDEAFAGIATAKANAERNLQNAQEMFDARVWSVFNRGQQDWPRKTLREIATDFGRGKSKHRPRNDPALYGGPYPFIQTGDVRNSSHLISEWSQTYSEAGLKQSKLWPQGTLCITIAANIAETGILGFDACFPDSVIGVVADPEQTSNKYLEYLMQSVKADLKAKGKGSAQDNINLGTFENERLPFPALEMQSQIVDELDAIRGSVADLESIYTRKLTALNELKQSLLHQAFSGQL